MQTITFECEVITPMFLAGADGTTPELRAPSIKGALRFWWRAMNGDLGLDKLKKKEANIFGGTEEGQGRSKIILIRRSCTKKILQKHISLTPHHKQDYCSKSDSRSKSCDYGRDNKRDNCSKASKRDATFYTFKFDIKYDDKAISKEDLEKLLKVTFLLGGLGKRSRRGFGSCQLSLNGLKCFADKKAVECFIKTLTLPIQSNIDYPYIEDIKIGKAYPSYFEILEDIGRQSHDFNGFNDIHLGFAAKKRYFDKQRMASPIYVSVFQDDSGFYPIISKLHCVFSKEVSEAIRGQKIINRSSKFINALT